jgi:hypothetical protein
VESTGSKEECIFILNNCNRKVITRSHAASRLATLSATHSIAERSIRIDEMTSHDQRALDLTVPRLGILTARLNIQICRPYQSCTVTAHHPEGIDLMP